MPKRGPQIDGDFAYEHPIEVRFVDTDAFGHVNNATYLSYFEAARAGYYAKVAGQPFMTGARGTTDMFVLAEARSRIARLHSSARRCPAGAALRGPAALIRARVPHQSL